MRGSPRGRRLRSAGAVLAVGLAVSAAAWVGGGPGPGLSLAAVYLVAALAVFAWSSRGDSDLAALLGGTGDERQRSLDLRATAAAAFAMGSFSLVRALAALARGADNPWLLVVLVGALSYAAALAYLRVRG